METFILRVLIHSHFMKKVLFVTAISLTIGFVVAFTATSRAAYETAPFTVIYKEGAVEIRDYPALTTVTTSAPVNGDRDGRFMKLFGYISGKNEQQQKIKMTTPVFMDAAKGQSKMSFVVPAKVAAAGAPTSGTADVVVEKRPAARYAVLRFNGLRRTAQEEKALAQLRLWLSEKRMSSVGEAVFAYYDAPWIPGLLRHNEVLLIIAAPPAGAAPKTK